MKNSDVPNMMWTQLLLQHLFPHTTSSQSHTIRDKQLQQNTSTVNFLLPNGRHTHPCGSALLLLLPFPFVTTITQVHASHPRPILYAVSPFTEKLTFDHANIVSPISYGQSDGLLVFLDEFHHLSFLQRGDPAADHRFTCARCRHKFCLHVCFQCMCLTQERSEGKR